MAEGGVLRRDNGSIDHDAYKGMKGSIDVNGMSVNVTVTDARVCYGRFDLCVEPDSGVGFRWVDHRNVQLNGAPVPSAVSTKSFAETLSEIRNRYNEATSTK